MKYCSRGPPSSFSTCTMVAFVPADEFRSNHHTDTHPWTKYNGRYDSIQVWDSNRGNIRHIPCLRANDRLLRMERANSRHSFRNRLHQLHHIPPMDLTDGMDGCFSEVEALSCEIMAKHRLLRQMSDFGPILDEEVALSRPSSPNHVNHLHHDPPMDLTEGMNRHIWGLEAVPCEITPKN